MSADPAVLQEGYARSAVLTRDYGTTYYWGARTLPAAQRRDVYSVYALCRLADDIVDAPHATDGEHRADTGTRLADFAGLFRAHRAGIGEDPVLSAVADTAERRDIPQECFERFFGAMASDLTVTSYPTYDDLLGYMEGSAAVIGEMMLPVLEPTDPRAYAPARDLGLAFQLTNFLRDVDEDLDRDRHYLPLEDLERFGVDPDQRSATDEWKALMRFEIQRTRALYAHADTGMRYLPPASARCVVIARRLYARILDLIEDADYDVFSSRVRLPTWRKAGLAARLLVTPVALLR
ncbi:phytoene/squalene synthase family protein [Allobranchiibius sp. GilTou73]|uniref:phytoene/squalene synthase family protein n=1 Tax=Allobranchiibius sp. GilTou73 TaxID=2904523 RepID=UPI001F256A10|nr:phytoene/squalene synthase family protein [Allobranchiibius sp. GilTou73]UIJ35824.1 phytoene/squalene synthase family protein [Allobranchiibius sp. GilTou73]